MKGLQPISPPYFAYFKSIVEAKLAESKVHLTPNESLVEDRYEVYQTQYNLGKLESILPITWMKELKDELNGCYENKTAPMSLIKKEIRNRLTSVRHYTCPYCGFRTPDTIDHYLPKTFFPEFAVLPLNLLPCCGICNGKKGNYWIEKGQRGIFNFYLDAPPPDQFLFVDLKFKVGDRIPLIDFNADFGKISDPIVRAIIEKHFIRLELINEYNEYCSFEIDTIRNELIYVLRSKDPAIIRNTLESMAENYSDHFGINYFVALFCKALSISDRFISDVIEEIV